MRIGKIPLKIFAGFVFGISFVLPPCAFGQAPFYQGKTITIIQAREAGGTGDLRVRAQVPFLRKYIPGNPTIVLEFMGGGGGRKAANHVYRTSAPDGAYHRRDDTGFCAECGPR
jgi:tripartite-type tricarboxylate transporter receptor subunit TctC